MRQFPLHRLLEFLDLTPSEASVLHGLHSASYEVERGAVVRALGDPVDRVFLLLEGWVISSIGLSTGARQIVKVHLPGDMLGSPSMVLESAAETLTAVVQSRVAAVSLEAFGALFTDAPRVAAAMFLSAQQERVLLMDRIASVGRSNAAERLAAFLLHIFDRLRVMNPAQGPAFSMPLTQEQIGDVIGLTAIHTNRIFREFAEAGLVRRHRHRVELLDVEALRAMTVVPHRKWVHRPRWMPAPADS